MLTLSLQLSSVTSISLSALSHSLSFFFCHFPGLSPSQTPISQALSWLLLVVMSTWFSTFYSTTLFYFLFLKSCYCFGKANHDMVLVALTGTLPNQVSIYYTYYCGVFNNTSRPKLYLSAKASDCGANDVMHVKRRVIVIFDCLL